MSRSETYDGIMRVSRITSNIPGHDNNISIRIDIPSEPVKRIEVRMAPEDYAIASTGLGSPCEITLMEVGKVKS